MRLRGSPTLRIHRVAKRTRAAGFDVSASAIEAHFLAGGRIEEVAELLATARDAGIEVDFASACAVDLVSKLNRKRTAEVLLRSMEPRRFEFGTFSSDEAIKGITLKKEKARVTFRFTYRYPFTAFDIDESFGGLRDRLGAFISAKIYASPTYADLMSRLAELETEASKLAQEHLATVEDMHIEISRD